MINFWKKTEYKVPLVFLVLSALWIVFSDILLFNHITNPEIVRFVSIFKGIFYISSITFLIYLITKRDMDKIREMNNKLTLSNDYYYSLFKDNHQASILINQENLMIEDANIAAQNLYKLNLNEIKKLKFSDLDFQHLNQSGISPQYSNYTKTIPGYLRTTHLNSDNELIEVEIFSGTVILNGRSIILAVIHDVTLKYRMETSLRESELKYKMLIDNIPDTIYVFSFKRGIQFISPQIKNLLGYLPDKIEMNSDIILNIVIPDDRNTLLNFRKNLFDSQEISECTYRIFDKNNNIKTIQDKVFSIRASDDDLIIEGVLADISEMKRLLDDLLDTKKKLNDNLKLMYDTFTGLNIEFVSIIDKIKFVSNELFDEDKNLSINDYISFVLSSSEKMQKALTSFLIFNEVEFGKRKLKMEETGLKVLLQTIYNENINYVHQNNLKFYLEVKENLKFFTDVEILSRICLLFIDYLVNATTQGSITLRGEFVTLGGMWVRIAVICAGKIENLEKLKSVQNIFNAEPESSSSKIAAEFVALGYSSKLIQLLEGKIEVQNLAEKETKLMIYLPFRIPVS